VVRNHGNTTRHPFAVTWYLIGRALHKVCEVREASQEDGSGIDPTLRKGDETLLATVEDRRRQDFS
jgi:hypothetical protein